MKNIYKNNIIALTLAIIVCPFLFTSVSAGYGLGETAGAADLMTVGGAGDVQTLIGNVIGTALSLISVIFFGLMLYGGFLWMTARGNTDQTRKALDTIVAAIIGIVVVLGAYALTRFVFTSLGSSSAGATGTQNTSSAGNNAICNTIDEMKTCFVALREDDPGLEQAVSAFDMNKQDCLSQPTDEGKQTKVDDVKNLLNGTDAAECVR
ncbi:MAG: pilin [Candidatus Magasanikbacteria bacterium]